MTSQTEQLELQLDSFDLDTRTKALAELAQMLADGKITAQPAGNKYNLHVHSFYSYNALGYSPSHIVWRAKLEGLSAVGLVDFDVLDGIDEFFAAGKTLGIRTTAGIETRVYVPEFSTRQISSPGEPGIAYQMGVGFTQSNIADPEAAKFAEMLRTNARNRNMAVVELVNAYLDPVTLDYQTEVLPLSPSGTPTERHLCAAYQKKAEQVFADKADRVKFWAEKLSTAPEKLEPVVDDDKSIQGLIRSKTMKSGGVGYQAPTPESFPALAEFNSFVAAAGGIPTATWLDGTSEGEAALDELLDLQIRTGAAMLNIIPDRNWNISDPETKHIKMVKLYEIVENANSRGLPIIVGTEMNSPGLKFVDSLDANELSPVRKSFDRGTDILCGESVAKLTGQDSYLSTAAKIRFEGVGKRNDHFAELGKNWTF